ncbi:DUF4153 domain-containing protein [Caulobacter segnis]|uniref:DUF4153 domain-containing protein n=1 Tax=Caulobacter segnis TaxID=88688 RepID=UPI00240F7A53|nr:DUF4153 domain-containing protein [Caulobacter segnis]MDG2520125.1 DUF4153 domain-containing protein [Caulobacter segnis]
MTERRNIAVGRLLIGLVQGITLFGLYHAEQEKLWPATMPALYGALFLTAAFAPAVLLAGIGALRRRTLLATFAGAVVFTLFMGAYGVWRNPMDYNTPRLFPGPEFTLTAAVALFVAYHLVEPAEAARRRIAPYAAYFETAWKRGVQLALSLGFTGVFWGLLFLGASLFEVIGIRFFIETIRTSEFAFTVTPVVFAAAVHLADVRSAMINGVRTVVLTLLAWLLPLLTLIVAGFLASLPFTGVDPLWSTRSAGGLMLAAAANLIILINAAWQDGEEAPHRILSVAVRVAAVLLAPLAGLAAWALALRIGQYGLSPERIIAAACTLIAAGYAVGYIAAVVRRSAGLAGLGRTNIAMAFVLLGLIAALFTPIADPMRLSVNDQLHRLHKGKVSAETFDYDFLRFQSGRFGMKALERLAADENPVIAREAKAAQKRQNRYVSENLNDSATRQKLYPAGAKLPAGFPANETICGDGCVALVRDLTGDGRDDVLVIVGGTAHFYRAPQQGPWPKPLQFMDVCRKGRELRDVVAAGRPVALVPSDGQDLIVDGGRLRLSPFNECGKTP